LEGGDRMAKKAITERFSKTIEGVLNITDGKIECEEYGELDLLELLNKFDGELVNIKIELKK
jgi:hypothetical protein